MSGPQKRTKVTVLGEGFSRLNWFTCRNHIEQLGLFWCCSPVAFEIEMIEVRLIYSVIIGNCYSCRILLILLNMMIPLKLNWTGPSCKVSKNQVLQKGSMPFSPGAIRDANLGGSRFFLVRWGSRSFAAVDENKVCKSTLYIMNLYMKRKRCKHVVYMIWWCPRFQR